MLTSTAFLFAIFTAISWAAYGLIARALVLNYSAACCRVVQMTLSYFLPALFIFMLVMPKGKINQVVSEFRMTTWRLPVLAFTGIIGYYLLLKTFKIAEASSVIPIVYSSAILTTIGGIIILKERGNIWQKIAGALLVFAGVVLLK